jgi:endoglucanase
MIRRARLTRRAGGLVAAAVVAGTLTAVAMTGGAASAASAAGTGTGWLHTSGSKIVDSSGATVKLTGINWFGYETDIGTFHGLWAGKPATWTQQLDHMASLGYNTIRVPYTGSTIRSTKAVSGVNSDTNPDLQGLTGLQILDKVVDYAGKKGMRIILDRHRPTTAAQTPLWNGGGVSEASIIDDWKFLASHYANNSTVVGADLFNEPHAEGTDPQGTGSNWGGGDARDWRLAAERIGNAILGVQPNWLIIVEGVSCSLPSGGVPNAYDNVPDDPYTCSWWGGNLSKARDYPVRLNVANRLVYSAHDYGISVYDHQDWFDTTKHPEFPANLPAVWDRYWGYLAKENIAPILVGEFGSTLADPRDKQWMTTLMKYIGDNGLSFTYWSWNPDSGDTGGIVSDDWNTVNQAKQNIVGPYLVPPVGGGTQTSPPPVSSTTTTSPPPVSSTTTTSPPPVSSTTPPPPTGACTATYKTVNSYPGGYQGEVTVKAGSAAISGWTVTWTLGSGQTISQLWSGQYTPNGSAVSVKNLNWNGSLSSGASTAFGFIGGGTASTPTLTCSAA